MSRFAGRSLKKRKRIMILLELRWGVFRAVLEGISVYRFSRDADPGSTKRPNHWSVQFGELPPTSVLAEVIEGQDGVIASLGTPEAIHTVARTGIPFVNVSGRAPWQGEPRVTVDHQRIGELGAEHLIQLGFTRLAFAGSSDDFEGRRLAGFVRAIERHHVELVEPIARIHKDDRSCLAKWPSPIGVMAQADDRAVQLANACIDCDLSIPEQVALVGVDNDESLCSICQPALSSVDPDGRAVGHQAGEVLDQLLEGRDAGPYPKLVPPIGVVQRASTDILAIGDTEVARAVRFIRDHLDQPLTVERVLDVVDISRPTLEKRFRDVFGRSVREEILRSRFDRARQMLIDTDLSVYEIGQRCGFSSYPRFITQFGKFFGESPSKLRKRFRN